MVKKRIPYWQETPMSLSEWQEAIEKNLLSLNQDLNKLVLKSRQLTTVEPTQTAPTTEVLSDADPASHPDWMDYIGQTTPPSLQSDQVDTKSGRVEHNSECAHKWENHLPDFEHMKADLKGVGFGWNLYWCLKCGALKCHDKIAVPDVARTSSTSVKQPSKESVENSVEESVKSLLNGLIKSFDGLKDFTPVTEHHKGYQEGILVAQSWAEMKLRELNRSN